MPAGTRRRRPEVDDEDVETPAPRRRRPAPDDEPEARPKRRSRPEPEEDPDEYDDDTESDEGDDEDDVEEAPRSRRRSARRAARDDDADDEPQPRRRRAGSSEGRRGSATSSSRRVASGWGAYERSRAANSDFETKFKPSSELQVVALLEDEPFHTFARHWVDLEEGKRAFICPTSIQYVDEQGELIDDDDKPACPLCEIGDKANTPKAYLNVAVLKAGKPEHAVWEIGPKVSEQLQVIDKSIGRRTKISEIYILATATGSGLNIKYHLEPLFEEDLREMAEDEDLPLKPLTEKQRSAIELYDESLYPVPSYKELDKIADALV